MQYFLAIVDTLSKIDIEGEFTLFLCSAIAFLVLMNFRNQKAKKCAKASKQASKQIQVVASQDSTTESDEGAHDEARYLQTDKALRTAFEGENYWQVLKCWNELKYSRQSSIHLSMVIRAMRFCNKGAYFIVTELKNFFKAHPQVCSIGLINDLLVPLARRTDDAQLVDLLVKMIPSINLVKDSRTYEILLTMYAASGNLAKTQEIMAEMKANDIPFRPRATVAVMTLGLHMGDIDAVLEALGTLKDAWDDRETWAVSIFALNGHKTNILKQIVTLACQKQQVCELSMALDDMAVPKEVLEAAQAQFALMSDVDLATTITVLEKTGKNLNDDPFYNTLVGCSSSRAAMKRSLPPWKVGESKLERDDSNVSTSEGCHSDSDEDLHPQKPVLPPWRAQKAAHSNRSASTSEGSRSDSEEEPNFGLRFRPPPGSAVRRSM